MSDTDNRINSERANRVPGTITSSLLGGIRDADRDAWGRVSALYAPLVYYWCRKQGLQSSDAEDVVQEVFGTVAARVEDFRRDDNRGSFRGWLRTITRHKLGDFIRAERRREKTLHGALVDQQAAELSGEVVSDDESGSSEETKLLHSRVLELIQSDFQERTWRAFLRVVIDGAAVRDVAEELDMSTSSVYQAKSRILRRIRDELADIGD